MADRDGGLDIQTISFRQTPDDLIVEITYSERRDQAPAIAMYKVLMFDAMKASASVADLLESAEDLVDEVLVKLQDQPMTLPGRAR